MPLQTCGNPLLREVGCWGDIFATDPVLARTDGLYATNPVLARSVRGLFTSVNGLCSISTPLALRNCPFSDWLGMQDHGLYLWTVTGC